jgi:hypothetical protein
MAEQSQTPNWTSDQSAWQPQQAGETPRAPQSALEAEAPRIERGKLKAAERPITDWASI